MEVYNVRCSDGTESGAISIEEIKSLVQSGKVKGTSMVYTESSKKWRLAASITEIRDLIREWDSTQDGVLDRIRKEGAEGHTTMMKARRKSHEHGGKGHFWKKLFGMSE